MSAKWVRTCDVCKTDIPEKNRRFQLGIGAGSSPSLPINGNVIDLCLACASSPELSKLHPFFQKTLTDDEHPPPTSPSAKIIRGD